MYRLIGWKTRTACLSMGIEEGSWIARKTNGRTSFVAVQRRLTHVRPACVTCYSLLWLSAV